MLLNALCDVAHVVSSCSVQASGIPIKQECIDALQELRMQKKTSGLNYITFRLENYKEVVVDKASFIEALRQILLIRSSLLL